MARSNRRHIPSAIKEHLVTMSMYLGSKNIEQATGISRRTVNRVLKLHRTTGSVVRAPLQAGRERVLNSLHVAVGTRYILSGQHLLSSRTQYLESLVERTPDIYISELQEQLEGAYGIRVSPPTITRTLKRAGFSRKKVGNLALVQHSYTSRINIVHVTSMK